MRWQETQKPARPFQILLAAAAVVALDAGGGCASAARSRFYPASVFRSARTPRATAHAGGPASARPARAAPAVALVEKSLRGRGLRFGTDGTPQALYQYVRRSHRLVPPATAAPGDVVFFDTSDGGRHGCATHAGVVDAVDPGGRIRFVEARGGRTRRSYLHPGRTLARRDESGLVLNSFLREKRIDDPPDARYFAGEMLCAVGRVGKP